MAVRFSVTGSRRRKKQPLRAHPERLFLKEVTR